MRRHVGLTLWLGGVFLLFLKPALAADCKVNQSTFSIKEPVPKGEILSNLPSGNWTFKSSKPNGYINLEKKNGKYCLKVVKEIDVEAMKVTEIALLLTCNTRNKSFTFLVKDVNEFPPKFQNHSYQVSVKEGTAKGTQVFNASKYVLDEDLTPFYWFNATPFSKPTIPPDGISSNMFKLSPTLGLVEVFGDLDYEQHNKYRIQINVLERSSIKDSAFLTINLINVDDKGPDFIYPNLSKSIGNVPIPPVYNSEISINYTGELPISPVPIEAKDMENNYTVKYSIIKVIPSTLGNYISINSSSGKMNVIQKLPADISSPGLIYVKAEDVSPAAHLSIAILTVVLTDKPITTTVNTKATTVPPNQTTETAHYNNTTLPAQTLSSSSASLSSVTSGPSQVTTVSLNSSLPAQTLSSSSASLSSVTSGPSQVTTVSLNSSLLPPASSSSDQGQTTGTTFTQSLIINTTPADTNHDKVSGTIPSYIFYTILGLFIATLLILVAVLVIFLLRRPKEINDELRKSNLARVYPSVGAPESENVSKESSMLNGIDNNAADLTDILESGQRRNDIYESINNYNTSPPNNNIVKNPVNVGSSLSQVEPLKSTYSSVSELPQHEGDSLNEPIPYYVTQNDLSTIGIDANTDEHVLQVEDDTEAQPSLDAAPVTMTFGDLAKKSCVSFADDTNSLDDNLDKTDNNDGLSYVDHINNDNNDDDGEESNNPDNSSESDSTEKTLENSNQSTNDAEEMTWLVAESDGEQEHLGQQQEQEEEEEVQAQMEQQQQLSYSNEIGYSPLVDDSPTSSLRDGDICRDSIRL